MLSSPVYLFFGASRVPGSNDPHIQERKSFSRRFTELVSNEKGKRHFILDPENYSG
jgi:hypothetical protein